MTAFTPTDRSRVKRLHERGRYDEDSVFAILDAGLTRNTHHDDDRKRD